jgi:hypothetical protein
VENGVGKDRVLKMPERKELSRSELRALYLALSELQRQVDRLAETLRSVKDQLGTRL